jgi:hypothetical protein
MGEKPPGAAAHRVPHVHGKEIWLT